jgi:glycosyltransferase involved in cell wall biosynthesis
MRLMNNIAFVTGFDPFVYRRPIFAKKALPNLKIYFYRLILKRLGYSGRLYSAFLFKASQLERAFLNKMRINSDAYFTRLLNEILYSVSFHGLNMDIIISLNPYFGSRLIWGYRPTIIIDWMDVWMWPWDEIHPLDVKLVREADKVIFWSKPMMEIITRRINLKKFTYVPYGIDFLTFNPMEYGKPDYIKERYSIGNRFVLLYSGGVWRVKGFDLQGIDKVLRAFAIVTKKLRDVILVLQISRIDEVTSRLIKKLGIANKSLIIGPLPYDSFERQSIFAAADVMLAPTSRHPTVYYAERMKFFDYMAAGKPIIAELSPGALSVLGNSAQYVKLGDIQGIADTICELYSNKELREELSEKTKKRSLMFRWDRLLPSYRDFILCT